MNHLKKRFVFLVLFALLLNLSACQTSSSSPSQTFSSADSSSLSDSRQSTQESSSAAGSAPEEGDPKCFYPAAMAVSDPDAVSEDRLYRWNENGSLTFQNKNALHTLSAENQLLETVTLPAEHLPQDTDYSLTWSDSLILALSAGWSKDDLFSVVYFTDDGGVHLANVTLFDRQGKLIRQYPQSQVHGYSEVGEHEIYLPASEGETVIDYANLGEDSPVYWLDGETAIFNCHSRVVLYDFSADEGKILDDMSDFVDGHGKFGVYYGVDFSQCGVIDGCFYYLAHRDEQKANASGTVWRADKNGAVQLLEGKEFYHLFVGNRALIAVSHTDQEGIDQVYCAAQNRQLEKIWEGNPSISFTDSGRISFTNQFGQENTVLYSYDDKTGELTGHELGAILQIDRLFTRMQSGSLCWYYTVFQHGVTTDYVHNTSTGQTEELPEGALGMMLSLSPDGNSFLEYDADAHALRVHQWDF